MRTCVLAFALAVLATSTASVALAAPSQNDNLGTWLDDYQDNLGIDYQPWPDETPKTTPSILHDAAGQAMILQSSATDGHFTTRLIQPASFTNWRALYFKYTAQTSGDVRVQLLDEDGTPLTQPLAPASAASWCATARAP